ncbi:carotenoid oxygenase family protein [uncultured Friedmanniella sp.]|uniref:carotenoid oxygenase family protein n=1 Tax=uncultured Friedmanniella sp. TaxID=335381 RepID=UPI0035CB3404
MKITEPDPAHLLGALAPVPDEIESAELSVSGSLPPELCGTYLRNGPNPMPGQPAAHWFTGAGMVHGIGLEAGRATCYRNRWVHTSLLDGAPAGGERGPALDANPANTSVIEHGGVLLALCEGGLPYQLTRDLDTVGGYDFGGRLQTAMTAHPKVDPVTGELFFFGYSALAPHLTYHVANATGRLVHTETVDVAGPTMMHDFALTEHSVVWLDLPVTFSLERWLSSGGAGMPYGWDDDYGARLGVMSRDGGPVRWFDVEPCYVFHIGNATEDAAGRIVLDAVRYDPASFVETWTGARPSAEAVTATQRTARSVLYRWTLDPATGSVAETALDDRSVEFPSMADHRTGRSSRYRYAVSDERGGSLVKYDLLQRSSTTWSPALPGVIGEASFVPAVDGRAEDDGWLLSLLTPEDGSASTLVVLDATDPAAGPTAAVTLPRRVPAGFHGSWIAAS